MGAYGTDFERQLVRTDAGYVHLRMAGEQAATPTVVLIHQSPASGRMWLGVMDELAPGVRSCAVDLLGYGESDHPGRQLSLEEHAEHVFTALDAAIDGPLLLVGHHTGAVMAAQIAATHPAAVRGLLLSGYPLYPDWGTKFDRLAPVLRPADIGPDGEELCEIWRYVTGPLETDADRDVALTIMTDRLRAGRRWFTGYVQLLAADLDDVLARAAQVDRERPTAVLTADRDPLLGYAKAVAARLGVEPTTISGTSWVSYEHPERFRDPILGLVARVDEREG